MVYYYGEMMEYDEKNALFRDHDDADPGGDPCPSKKTPGEEGYFYSSGITEFTFVMDLGRASLELFQGLSAFR